MKTKIEISLEELLKLAQTKVPDNHQCEITIYERLLHINPHCKETRRDTGITIEIEPEEE